MSAKQRTRSMTRSATEPKRIQRRRVKGWRMPENAVYVGRGSKWGNPYPIGSMHPSGDGETWVVINAATAVSLYRAHLEERLWGRPSLRSQVSELAGKDLACWCAPDKPCHADILLELANR